MVLGMRPQGLREQQGIEMTNDTMTLAQVAWKLDELAKEGGVRYGAHDMAVTCSQLADSVLAHLAKESGGGEAVGYASEDCDGDPVWSIATKEGIYSIVCAEGGGFQLLHTEGTKLKVVSKPFTLAQPKGEHAQPVDVVDDAMVERAIKVHDDELIRGAKGDTWKAGELIRSSMRAALTAALAHPRPTGERWSVKVPAEQMAEAILSMQGPDGEALDGTLWLGPLDDGTYGVHLSCDECPEEGSITLAVLPAPTGEKAGEVVTDNFGLTSEQIERLRRD
jgi:hypothetical protein